MKITEILNEGVTDVVYHYATTLAASDILRDGVFKLADASEIAAEAEWAPNGYPFFMSTTRSKVGDYHNKPGPSGVIFVLDGRWLGERYVGRPIDYWQRSWSSTKDRTSESEDRIFSKENTIPITPVLEVHLLNRLNTPERAYQLRSIILNAKKRGIPLYFYNDQSAWLLQDKRKAIPVEEYRKYLKGQEPSRINRISSYSYFDPWIELLFKKSTDELSSRAKRIAHDIMFSSHYGKEDIKGLKADLANSSKPGRSTYEDALKFKKHMRRFGLTTLDDLTTFLVNKWKKK